MHSIRRASETHGKGIAGHLLTSAQRGQVQKSCVNKEVGQQLTSSTPSSSISVWKSISVAAWRVPAAASPSPLHVVQKPVICTPTSLVRQSATYAQGLCIQAGFSMVTRHLVSDSPIGLMWRGRHVVLALLNSMNVHVLGTCLEQHELGAEGGLIHVHEGCQLGQRDGGVQLQ